MSSFSFPLATRQSAPLGERIGSLLRGLLGDIHHLESPNKLVCQAAANMRRAIECRQILYALDISEITAEGPVSWQPIIMVMLGKILTDLE